jgi:thiol-disulfide isomerase/thioredoxin
MLKRIPLLMQFATPPPSGFLFVGFLFVGLLPAAPPPQRAQAAKPSQVLRQLEEQEKKSQQAYQRKIAQAMERAAASKEGAATAVEELDPDEVNESVIKFAAERAAGFKIGDWNEDELYALATLYQIAEQFTQAAEAYRTYLKKNSYSKLSASARTGLIHSLIETQQVAEAEKLLEGSSRTGSYKDLALSLHSRNQYVEAATISERGYKRANSLARNNGTPPEMRETAEENQVVLGAIMVAASERIGQKKRAADLNRMIMESDFNRRPELRSIYQSELAAARLIGTSAPELDVARWVDGKQGAPRSLNELRGKVVLLDFSAMWCAPCAAAFPRQRGFQEKFAGRGFEIIGVTKFYGRSDHQESLTNEQELKSLQAYRTRHQLTYPVAVGKMDDVTNEERYGVTGVPTVILIDRLGRVRQIKRGVGEYRKLEKQIEELIAEK